MEVAMAALIWIDEGESGRQRCWWQRKRSCDVVRLKIRSR